MFGKLLIANRGEIARRIARTARRLGVATVAVHSDADRLAPHVLEADEAVRLGPPPAAESYLRVEAILDACRATGAEAVHPGYGFLSENPALPEALEAEGLVFVGPPASAIRAMGDKIESKRLAREAGVETIPGPLEALSDPAAAVEVARDIGLPVMLKASAGGGGKGMRIARTLAEVESGFASAQREAASSFGDDRVFVERMIERPRHVEIQVLADSRGKVLHFGERECSAQRRHQKVLEEAPSPVVSPDMRAEMGAQAVALAEAVGYRSAGTVEFVVGEALDFHFLEMNTRLQVEHPVTELVYGLDLVEWMLRIAAGEALPFEQAEIRPRGWALEARIYAEDSRRGFLPSSGPLVRYREPPAEPGLRIDSGVAEGGQVPLHYDPMIAKLIVSAEDRTGAIEGARRALEGFVIEGPETNVSFLTAILGEPAFRAGEVTTDFLDREYGKGFPGAPLEGARRNRIRAIAALVAELEARRHGEAEVGAWSLLQGREAAHAAVEGAEGRYAVALETRRLSVETVWRPFLPLFEGRLDGEPVRARLRREGTDRLWIAHDGAEVSFRIVPHRLEAMALAMADKASDAVGHTLRAPMPGRLVSLAVEAGEAVEAGQTLAVMEAMKMETALAAEAPGEVAEILARPGAELALDQPILVFA